MATTVNLNVTYNGKEPESIGQAIVKEVLNSPELTSLGFAVRTDVRTKEKMYMISMDEDVTRKRVGCGTPDEGGVTMDEKYMDPTNLEISQHYCAEDFAGTIAELARKVGADVNDLTDTDIEAILKALVTPIWKRDKVTIATLGDTANGSAKINQLDGIWKQIFAGVALAEGDNDHIKRAVTVPAGALAKDYAIDTFLPGLYFGQGEYSKQVDDAQKQFDVTGSIYDNYIQSLIANKTLESSWVTLQNGVKAVTYMGIPVVPVRLWDQKIASLLAGALPNRGMLFVKDAVQVWNDTETEDAVMDFWYDKTTDKNYLRIRYKMAVGYFDGDYITVGY